MSKNNVTHLDGFDVVIAGGGPSGCVLAKDLTKAGKRVILIEKGGNNTRGIGTSLGMLNGEHMEKAKFPSIWQKTLEGDNVVVGTGIGGGSYLYAGIAGMPLFKHFTDAGMDLEPYLEDAKKESWVNKTPDEFLGETTKKMLDVTNGMGLPFQVSNRHINFDKCKYGCTTAAFGCKYGAKWMGYYAANEAAELGATLQIYTRVRNVIIENGKAVGVNAINVKTGEEYEIRGTTVVCAAGGIGDAMILMASGIREAGTKLFGDPSFGSYGLLPADSGLNSTYYEHGTSIAMMDDELGCLYSTDVSWGRLFWSFFQVMSGGIPKALNTFRVFPRRLGLFNKIHDDGVGRITFDGKVSKIMTTDDQEKMNYVRSINQKILIAMGCPPSSIVHTGLSHEKGGLTYGHPGGTAQVGVVVNNELETDVKNLFVCSISSLPGAPSRPPVLTLVTQAKWFVPRLIARLEGVPLSSITNPNGHKETAKEAVFGD